MHNISMWGGRIIRQRRCSNNRESTLPGAAVSRDRRQTEACVRCTDVWNQRNSTVLIFGELPYSSKASSAAGSRYIEAVVQTLGTPCPCLCLCARDTRARLSPPVAAKNRLVRALDGSGSSNSDPIKSDVCSSGGESPYMYTSD